ncbi:MAG: hypothetical protein ISQ11_12435 [Planctomycetes bacterium]|nr:hypothetical protein [Planctomycetota bacterium]
MPEPREPLGLADAIRGAAIPSLAGMAYELSGLAWVLGGAAALTSLAALAGDPELVSDAVGSGVPIPGPLVATGLFLAALPLLLVCSRVGGGAARLSIAPDPERPTTLLRSWAEGKSVQTSAAAIWIQIFGMMACGTFVLLGPIVALTALVGPETLGPFGVVLSGLALVLTLAYAAELGALHQLALASLVRHDRGVGSAVLHGWRLMRARPEHMRRLAAAEFALRALILIAASFAGYLAGGPWGLAQLALLASLVGSVRCRAWSLIYPRLGGLSVSGGPRQA